MKNQCGCHEQQTDFEPSTHTISVTVDQMDAPLLKSICADAQFQGQRLEPRVVSVDAVESASTKQRRLEQLFGALIVERYNNLVLNFTAVCDHAKSELRVDWTNKAAGPAFCAALKRFCTGCQTIVLDGNGLTNLSLFSQVARECPTVVNLSLANNKIKEWTQFEAIRNLRLRNLIIRGNPIAELPPETCAEEAKAYFPMLDTLDQRDLKPQMSFFAQPVALPPIKTGHCQDPAFQSVMGEFVKAVLPVFGSTTAPEEQIASLYNENAFYSVCLAPEIPAKQLAPFRRVNRNLRKDSSPNTIIQCLFLGRAKIAHAVKTLLPVSFPEALLVCDALDLSPAASLGAVHMLCFCGTAIVQSEQYSFRRIFVLLSSADGRLTILNDQMTLLPFLGKNVAIPTANAIAVSTQLDQHQALLTKFVTETRLIPSRAKELLSAVNWDYAVAVQEFHKLQSAGRIPPDYFAQ